MLLPPGPAYVLISLPSLVLPPSAVAVALLGLRNLAGLRTPAWVSVVACLTSWPISLLLGIAWRDFATARAAAAAGAVLPPRTKKAGFWGRYALLWKGRERDEYPCYNIAQMFEAAGSHCVLFAQPQTDQIYTSEPEHIKLMLATDFGNFEKGQRFIGKNRAVLGSGVFNADGDMWKFHRAMTRPYFSRERIGHFDTFDAHTADALGRMRVRLHEGHAVDFQDLINRFTLDTATVFLFGTDVRSLSAPLPYPYSHVSAASSEAQPRHPADVFAAAFAAALGVLARRGPLGHSWPLREFWWDKSTDYVQTIRAFVDPLVDAALRRREIIADKKASGDRAGEDGESESESEGEGAGDTLLDHLVAGTDDRTLVRDEILNIMIAGRDTTASTLTFAVYLLAQHPAVLVRLRAEVLATVGPAGRPTTDDIKEMRYLRAVINETLRLFPAVPNNQRQNVKATTWPNKTPGGKPFYIPAGTNCAYSVFVMHRRTDLWGPDALEFDPDRFLDARLQTYLTPNPFIFLPFNAGPRICLGQQFAYNEMSFVLIRLLQSFRSLALAPDACPLSARTPLSWVAGRPGFRREKEVCWPERHLTLFVKGGLWIRAEDAGAAGD